jgi:hypothetical protein
MWRLSYPTIGYWIAPGLQMLILASPVLEQLFANGYNKDPFPNKILKLIRDVPKHCHENSLAECDEQITS